MSSETKMTLHPASLNSSQYPHVVAVHFRRSVPRLNRRVSGVHATGWAGDIAFPAATIGERMGFFNAGCGHWFDAWLVTAVPSLILTLIQ